MSAEERARLFPPTFQYQFICRLSISDSPSLSVNNVSQNFKQIHLNLSNESLTLSFKFRLVRIVKLTESTA